MRARGRNVLTADVTYEIVPDGIVKKVTVGHLGLGHTNTKFIPFSAIRKIVFQKGMHSKHWHLITREEEIILDANEGTSNLIARIRHENGQQIIPEQTTQSVMPGATPTRLSADQDGQIDPLGVGRPLTKTTQGVRGGSVGREQLVAIEQEKQSKHVARVKQLSDDLWYRLPKKTDRELMTQLLASDSEAKKKYLEQMDQLAMECPGQSRSPGELEALRRVVNGIFFTAIMRLTGGALKGKELTPEIVGLALPREPFVPQPVGMKEEQFVEEVASGVIGQKAVPAFEVKTQKHLKCENCSAKLDYLPGALFAKCKYCGLRTNFVVKEPQ